MEEDEIKKEYSERKAWGLSSSIDLQGCDSEIIRSEEKIRQFVDELCILIDMNKFGECIVVNFGEDENVEGYSMIQLIETSLISGHFANKTNRVFLDVFSCKYYSPKVVGEFAKKFFNANSYNFKFLLRE